MKMQKTIIFGAPDKGFISEKIIKNLQFLGFNVVNICFDQNYTYKSKTDQIKNFLSKTFLNDKSVKKKLRFAEEKANIEEKLSQLHHKADYAFIIRPDVYPKEFLKYLKGKCNEMIGYQWDGMKRFPDVQKYVQYFDRFFVFDEADVRQNQLPLTNFYFDYETPSTKNFNPKSVYFVGNYFKNRVNYLDQIADRIKKNHLESNIMILSNKKQVIEKYKNTAINIIQEPITFERNLELVNESGILIDVSSGVHNGLSFRTFEALGSDKKLITSNKSIRNYDFYDPNNIFIVENEDMDGFEDFLAAEYRINQQLKEKYSFTNWIKYVLNIHPHQSISLPSISLN